MQTPQLAEAVVAHGIEIVVTGDHRSWATGKGSVGRVLSGFLNSVEEPCRECRGIKGKEGNNQDPTEGCCRKLREDVPAR